MTPSLVVVAVRSACVMARLVALLVAARQLPPDQFAMIALAIAVAEIGKVLADAGVDVYSLREYGRAPGALPDQALRVLLTKSALNFACTIMLLAILPLVAPELPIAYLVPIAVWPALQLGLNYFLNIALIQGEPGWLLLPTIIAYGLYFIGFALAFFDGRFAPFVFIGLAVVEAVLLVSLHKRSVPLLSAARLPTGLSDGCLRVFRIVRAAFPVGLAAAIAVLYGRLDLFAIEWQLTEHDVGLYAFAARLLEPGLQLYNGWVATKGGRYAGLWAASVASYRLQGKRLLVLSLAAAACAAGGTTLMAPMLLRILFPAFIQAEPVLIILAMTLIPRICNNTMTTLLIAAHQERFIPWVSLINLCTLSIALCQLVPAYGLVGAACGILLVESSNTVLQGLLLRRAVRKQSIASGNPYGS